MDKETSKKHIVEKQKDEKDSLESTLQDSSFDISLEYEILLEEPYDKNRINTEHL